MFYLRSQSRSIILYSFPYLLGFNCIIAMYKDMPHSLYELPFNLGMCVFKFFRQLIDCFAYNLNTFNEAKEHDGIVLDVIKRVFISL